MPCSTPSRPGGKNALGLYFAHNVGREMALRGWTQVEIARRLGWPQSRISDMLRGTRNYSLDTVDKVAGVLDLQAITLLVPPTDPEIMLRIQTKLNRGD